MIKQKYADFPFEEIAEAMEKYAAQGCDCYQKFTCANCGQRLTMDVPNVLFEKGDCDKCGAETDIRKQGCNYVLTRTF